nr:hypothetical protein [Tanacetum cinerariifolium]
MAIFQKSFNGKENRVNILKLIDEGPFQMGTVREPLAKGTEGAPHLGYIARNCTQPKRPQNFNYYKDKMLLMQAQENGVALDEERLLFLVDDFDVFDYDVDEAPTEQTMFMVNLSSVDPVYDEAGSSYDSDILSKERIVLKIVKINRKPDNIYTRSEATKKSQIRKQFFIK